MGKPGHLVLHEFPAECRYTQTAVENYGRHSPAVSGWSGGARTAAIQIEADIRKLRAERYGSALLPKVVRIETFRNEFVGCSSKQEQRHQPYQTLQDPL